MENKTRLNCTFYFLRSIANPTNNLVVILSMSNTEVTLSCVCASLGKLHCVSVIYAYKHCNLHGTPIFKTEALHLVSNVQLITVKGLE